jgi:hypothetical protein
LQLRFVSWNMHGKRRLDGQLGLLQYVAGELVVFQEVIANAYNEPIACEQALCLVNFYNTTRPHESLDYRSPDQYAQEQQLDTVPKITLF